MEAEKKDQRKNAVKAVPARKKAARALMKKILTRAKSTSVSEKILEGPKIVRGRIEFASRYPNPREPINKPSFVL